MLRLLPRAAAAALSAAHALSQPVAECEGDRLARWRPKWKGTVASSAASWHIGRETHPRLAEFEAALFPSRTHANWMRRRVLVPLAGASHDVAYLAGRGHDVVAVEGVPAALDAFKAEYGVPLADRTLEDRFRAWAGGVSRADPKYGAPIRATHAVRLPKADGSADRDIVTWHEADFLDLIGGPNTAFNEATNSFDAAFDRGGLVAVAPGDRDDYAAVLARLLMPGGRLLLVVVEHPPFDGGTLGPPHAVDAAEVARLFSATFAVEPLAREDRLPLEPHWADRGCAFFVEATYLLTRKQDPLEFP